LEWIVVLVTTVDGSCDGGWQTNFGNEYCYDSDSVTQSTARSTCQSRDAELTSISSDAECDYLANNLMSVDFLRTMLNITENCTDFCPIITTLVCNANKMYIKTATYSIKTNRSAQC